MSAPIKHCAQPDPPELVMRADGYHYRTEGEMKELTDEQIKELWENADSPVQCMRAAIAADRALNAPADWDAMRQVPDGWRLVPKNPDLDQYNAACRAYVDWQAKCQEEARAHENEPSESWFYSQPHFTHTDVYIAMLAAAPTPPAPSDRDVMRQMLRSVERTHAGYMVGHDKSDAPAGSYSDGFTRGFGECVRLLRELGAERTPPAEQQREQEPVAFLTRDEDGTPAMLFLDAGEATAYCGENEVPEPLYTHPPSPPAEQPFGRESREAKWNDRLLGIIAIAYQILGALNAPVHILDVLSDPLGATDEQIDAMLPFAPAEQQVAQEPVAWMTPGGDVTRSKVFADEQSALSFGQQRPTPLYTHPSPTLAELRAKVEALPSAAWYGLNNAGYEVVSLKENHVLREFDAGEITANPLVRLDDVLAEIDKMGGGV